MLRFGPLTEGMLWARLEGEQWVGTDHDYGVMLVTDAHERRPEWAEELKQELLEQFEAGRE